ncbi:Uncharacterised protein [Rodentibacter pneumotropicus]|uniref:Uncharacterized protein n=1 Tax=Rodentibacter pneumotropicus TaxID=758 RepID=A0A3S4W455_9PAST|nr:Uncharacterised protein [Rodentibacter pneumotropicus]
MNNVILHYQDGRTFICAEGVTLARAEEIKAYVESNPDDFSYRNVVRVEIKGTGTNTKPNLVRSPQIEETEKTQQKTQGATKGKYKGKLSLNPLAFAYAQITRQFRLISESNKRCFELYPDDFHHKLKMRSEMADLVERLKAGGKLFNVLAKSQGVTLTKDNVGTLKDFNQANGYLIYKFNEVIEQIDLLNIERIENQVFQDPKKEFSDDKKGAVMNNLTYQVIGYSQQKPIVLGSTETHLKP